MRLINADVVEQKIRNAWINNIIGFSEMNILKELLKGASIIEAEPIKYGHWIECKGSNGKDYRKCSECLHTQEITGLLNYCPVCGAKMEG